MWKKLFNELVPFIAFVSAILLAIFLFPIGIIWHFFKPFYDAYKQKKKLLHIILSFFTYWFKMLYQLWCGIKYLLKSLALTIDILGNVVVGEFLEDTITHEEDTLFMDGDTTISASVGKLEKDGKLNIFGKFLTYVLSEVFEKNHSVNAYDKKIMDDEFNKQRGITF